MDPGMQATAAVPRSCAECGSVDPSGWPAPARWYGTTFVAVAVLAAINVAVCILFVALVGHQNGRALQISGQNDIAARFIPGRWVGSDAPFATLADLRAAAEGKRNISFGTGDLFHDTEHYPRLGVGLHERVGVLSTTGVGGKRQLETRWGVPAPWLVRSVGHPFRVGASPLRPRANPSSGSAWSFAGYEFVHTRSDGAGEVRALRIVLWLVALHIAYAMFFGAVAAAITRRLARLRGADPASGLRWSRRAGLTAVFVWLMLGLVPESEPDAWRSNQVPDRPTDITRADVESRSGHASDTRRFLAEIVRAAETGPGPAASETEPIGVGWMMLDPQDDPGLAMSTYGQPPLSFEYVEGEVPPRAMASGVRPGWEARTVGGAIWVTRTTGGPKPWQRTVAVDRAALMLAFFAIAGLWAAVFTTRELKRVLLDWRRRRRRACVHCGYPLPTPPVGV